MIGGPQPPVPIAPSHRLEGFNCGEPTLDEWLTRRALKNQETGASRTYVVCDDERVIAYYSLAAGAVTQSAATGKVRRNMPEPNPVMILGRLAVDNQCKGLGLGRALLRDAMLRTVQAADLIGIRAILVHAISDSARTFYLANGFKESPLDPMMLMVTVAEVRAALES